MGDAERFEIVRPLGADAAGFVARDTSIDPARLVVLERATRAAKTQEERARVVQRCKALVALEHPKVVPVREVVERDGEVLVVCDFVDGEWLTALMAVDPRPPVEVLLRIMLDVLEGLAALHDLRDERGQPLRVVHGALSPDSVLVADDGVAEIARPFGMAPQKPDRFVAPELRRGEAPVDVRADVYSAGAILREILGGASADAKWAEQLTDIAWRACSVDPENRWPSAASMATTLRRIAGSKLASSDDLAKFLRRYFGNRMNARRAALDMRELEEAGPPSSGEPISVRPSEMVVIDPPSAPTLVESRPPPVPHRSPVAKVALVKKALEIIDIPEPAVERHVGTVTHKGMAAIAPPPAQIIEPPLRPKAVSLPPPDIIVPDVIIEPALSVRPQAAAARTSAPPKVDDGSESYRRKMPTFPTMDSPTAGPLVGDPGDGDCRGHGHDVRRRLVARTQLPASRRSSAGRLRVARVPADCPGASAGDGPGGRRDRVRDNPPGRGCLCGAVRRRVGRDHRPRSGARGDGAGNLCARGGHGAPDGGPARRGAAAQAHPVRDGHGRRPQAERRAEAASAAAPRRFRRLRARRALSAEPGDVDVVQPRALPAREHPGRAHHGGLELGAR